MYYTNNNYITNNDYLWMANNLTTINASRKANYVIMQIVTLMLNSNCDVLVCIVRLDTNA